MLITQIEMTGQTVKDEVDAIAKQAAGLATGLQNVAPATSGTSPSIIYLMAIAQQLSTASKQIDELISSVQNRVK